MSTKQSRKSNFFSILLITCSIFLFIQLMVVKPAGPVISAPVLLDEIKKSNAELRDTAILSQVSAYEGKINEARDKKEITPAQHLEKLIQVKILVADTQLKSGIARSDTGRIRNAYATIVWFQNTYPNNPAWKKSVLVSSADKKKRFEWNSWTGTELYKFTISKLIERNKTDLIWGFVPGGFYAIDVLVKVTGGLPGFSYWFAALLLAVIVRGSVFHLTQRQINFGRKISQLSPMLKELQTQYKDDPRELQTRTMAMYQKYGVNPMQGCLVALVQLPLFLTVYQCMLHYQFEFEKGTFLWINPVLHLTTNGLTASNLGHLDIPLIFIYGVSMVVTTLLQPISDPSQLKQQRIIGVFFAVFATVSMFTGIFPVAAAFVLYWTFTNVLATAQVLWTYRTPAPMLVEITTKAGGVLPIDPAKSSSILGKTGVPVKHKPKKRN